MKRKRRLSAHRESKRAYVRKSRRSLRKRRTVRQVAQAKFPPPVERTVLEPMLPPLSRETKQRVRYLKRLKLIIGGITFLILLAVLLATGLRYEFEHSYLQAYYFSKIGAATGYRLGVGPSSQARFPTSGPYNKRTGYTDIPIFQRRLVERGYKTAAQAYISARHADLIDLGLFPIYEPKLQHGLNIYDAFGVSMFQERFPRHFYKTFEEIPPKILQTLLYIEDRNLLRTDRPHHNPAIEWDRFARGILDMGIKVVDRHHNVQGGSTLATQIEKYKYSPDGITRTPREKILQMSSAAIRAYMRGPLTLEARQRIALDYLNSVPLAALPGAGEINGLGDGLWAYFDADFETVNSLLRQPIGEPDSDLIKQQAQAYRQVLSLFLAHRRPTDYLGKREAALDRQVARYLPIMSAEGIIPAALAAEAAKAKTPVRQRMGTKQPISFLERKSANAIRTRALELLGVPQLYDLDRLDLTIQSSLDVQAERRVTEILSKLADKDFVRKNGLDAFRLLDSRTDLGKVIYSFTLYERTPEANLLRIQTDNIDQPFNFNDGVKLDLGSTSKFRTLITYLEIISSLYGRFVHYTPAELRTARTEAEDPLTRWTIDFLLTSKEKSLTATLEAAMQRKYSANPGERFFTAGGMHTFHNFNSSHNGGTYPIAFALRHSINLPFIRLMRDIVRYYSATGDDDVPINPDKMDHAMRLEYLRRFADREGKVFMREPYERYRGKSPEEIRAIFTKRVHGSPRRYASLYWATRTNQSLSQFKDWLRSAFPDAKLDDDDLEDIYQLYSVRALNLADVGYIARLHPLEVWIASYLISNPTSSYRKLMRSSEGARQESYTWLFNTSSSRKQNSRIRQILELDAFKKIHAAWERVGYRLPSLVPSYATALGVSADRPDSLAELVGIVLNDGQRLPHVRITDLEFGADTPFWTRMVKERDTAQQIIPPQVARVAKAALFDVVQNGTAIRLRKGLDAGKETLPVGGKTGTGDHRFKTFTKGGAVKEAKAVSRTATFVFIIGDRFFGSITAYVAGSDAAKYGFTSSLPVQLLKILEPALQPLFSQYTAQIESDTL